MSKKTRPKPEIYIGMQPDEDVARATCGCVLYRTGHDAGDIAGAGWNDDPLVTFCALHEGAEELIDLIARMHKDGECGAHGPSCKGRTSECVLFGMSPEDAQETLERLIAKARTLRAR